MRVRIDAQHPVQVVGTGCHAECVGQWIRVAGAPLAQQLRCDIRGKDPHVRPISLLKWHVRGCKKTLRKAHGVEQRRVAIARQLPAQREQRAPQPRRKPPEIRLIVVAEVPSVAAEQFVPAYAGKNHRDVSSGELRNQIGCDKRGIGDGLIHVPEQSWQQGDDVGADENFVVIRAERLGDLARIGQLVVEGLRTAALEPDRVGLDRPVAVRRHERHDCAGIDSPGKECAYRHVAHHLHPHRFLEPCAHAPGPFALGQGVVDVSRHAPEAPLLDAAAFGDQHRCRRKFADTREDRLRRRNVSQGKVGGECGRIELGLDAGYG